MDKDELTAVRRKPNQDLIGELERLLAEAKKGELQGLVWATVWSNDKTGSSWRLRYRHHAPWVIGELHMAMIALANTAEGIDPEIIRDGPNETA